MTRLIATITMLWLATSLSAQITLEKSYNYSGTFIELENSGAKFYLMDVPNKECRIYNADHSIWKTLKLTIPQGYYLYDIKYVSENLFNQDNNLELLYIYYKYVVAGDYYQYETRVVNEQGNVLLKVPGGGFGEIKNVGDLNKLLVYVYDYSVSPYTVSTNVYSINSTITSLKKALESNAFNLAAPYPNPAGNFVTVPYQLPEGTKEASLVMYNASGSEISRYRIDNNFTNLQINTSQLGRGMFIYKLFLPDGNISEGKKIFVK